MKQSEKKLLVIELLLLVALFLNTFVINIFNEVTLLFLVFGIFILLYLLVGFEKNNHEQKKDIILNMIIFTLLFQFVSYFSGLFIGFIKSAYRFNFLNLLLLLFPNLLLIIFGEWMRQLICCKGEYRKLIIVLSTIIFVFLDITFLAPTYDFSNIPQIFDFCFSIVIPSISKNILLTYLVLKVGSIPTIIYQIVMGSSLFILPIYPNFNLYLKSLLLLLFPLIILYQTYRTIHRQYPVPVVSKNSKLRRLLLGILTIFLLLNIYLTSGVFTYFHMAIGSGSMEPAIHVGDAVIVKKLKKNELVNLQQSDILIFKQHDKIYIHRIVDINIKEGKYYFQTKGDYNDYLDPWIVDSDSVVGIMKWKIPFMGYPTVWLNSLKTERSN